MKLFDSELNIMEILWRDGDFTAKRIAEITKENIGWSKTTTYTFIKRCLDKGQLKGKSQISFAVRLLHGSRRRNTKQQNLLIRCIMVPLIG